jgi:hypothetical protein
MIPSIMHGVTPQRFKQVDAVAAGNDPMWESVACMLHCNGTDASTTITDSRYLSTWTCSGDAKLATAQKQFGSASIVFDGTGDYVSASSNSLFAFGGDFTIECWLYVNASVAAWARVIENEQYNVTGGWHISFNGSDSGGSRRLGFQVGLNGGGGSRIDSNAAFPTAAWTHYAVTRSGSTIRTFVGGTKQTATLTDSQAFTATAMRLGSVLGTPGNYYWGYIDEVRLTKGFARWTDTFTPAAAEYVDF